MAALLVLATIIIGLKFYPSATIAFFSYLHRVFIATSVLLNVLLGGPNNQTFSARNWTLKRQGKINAVLLIDSISNIFQYFINLTFRLLKQPYRVDFSDHCLQSWSYWRVRKDVVHAHQLKEFKD